MTVKEVSRLSGVSVRTLHYYDQIGLLTPSRKTEAGYRIYEAEQLERLWQILLFRTLGFSLEEIRTMLDSPAFDRKQALRQQIALLTMKQEQLGRMIELARELLQTGGDRMDFEVFDTTEMEQYAEEAKRRWQSTDAYQEYAGRRQPPDEAVQRGLMECFAVMGTKRALPPEHPEVQAQVHAIRQYITEHFYTCTPEILRALGEMYLSDERFRKTIDRAGGTGTAELTARAIAIYCDRS
ncbi:MAG: MerR family transcriptional regulator [Butyricicoccaceae bacterium]